jgi:HSP20 family protein
MEVFLELILKENVDVVDSESSIDIFADVPGYDLAGIDVSVEGDVLKISGKREMLKDGDGVKFLRQERNEEWFARSFTIDESLDKSKIKAAIKDGVLKVSIQKAKQPKSTFTKVKIEQA